MSKAIKFLSALAVLIVAITLNGCSDAKNSSEGDGHEHSDDCDHEDDAEHDAEHDDGDDDGDGDGDDDAEAAADAKKEKMLEGLSAEDRAAVEAQRICPVSEGLLWNMAKPVKVTVTGSDGKSREVFLCCKSCENEIKADPDKYLAKLDE